MGVATLTPTLRTERSWLRSGANLVAGIDEVGRGALAGPVTVGIVVVGLATATAPRGVRDSKLLRPDKREHLVPAIERWCEGWAVASATPQEIDRMGMTRALRVAGWRAIRQLGVQPEVIIVDGSHNWLTPPGSQQPRQVGAWPPLITPLVKADARCSSVAAASVLAKVWRDTYMKKVCLDHPEYGWQTNMGYGSAAHETALQVHGTTPHHRLSWRLPRRRQPLGL